METSDMERDNPYEYKDKSNRIYNWSWAIFFMIFGFGLGVGGAVWLWKSWGGGGGLFTDLSTTSEWVIDIVLSIVLGFLAIVLVWVGFTAPVFWSEIGEKLFFRRLLGVQTSEWSDVKAMKFDVDESDDAATAAWRKRNASKTLEITLFENDVELTVTIPAAHYDRIVKLAAEHGFVLDESEGEPGDPDKAASESSQRFEQP